MDTNSQEYARLRAEVIRRLNAHDLAGVMNLGVPADEYSPEAEDLAALMAQGVPITAGLVADIWHKWFGEPSGQPGAPTPAMEALAADIRGLQSI